MATETGADAESCGPRSPTRPVFHTLAVAAVERLTDDSAAVTFEVPGDLRDAFAFRAGQSLTLRRVVGGVQERRSYSICAPVGHRPRIGVRRVAHGLFSSWLVDQVGVGDLIEVQTPTGAFHADPDAGGRHLCVAAGSGITPMLSIAASVLANPAAQVTLLYGNRRASSVMFADELADLKNRHGPRLEIAHILSREPRDVELLSGRLDAERLRRLLRLFVPLDAVDQVWLCGPFGMIADACVVLAESGVPAERTHIELFYVDEPPPQPARGEQAAPEEMLAAGVSAVTITIDGRTATASSPKARTILDGAASVRSDLPFACRGGVCGTCRARVTAGEVDMRRNYALADDEVQRGFVLTCQSYPVGDAVAVDFDA